MLTAIRELAEEAEAGGDLAAVVARGDDCVARTRELLPVLTEAGVVDAGAAGLVEILRGIAGALEGEPLPAGAGGRSSGPDASSRSISSSRSSGTAPPSSSRATGSTRTSSSASSSRSATRCSSSATPRRSRFTSTPTTRAARSRSASRAGRSRTSRSRTCTSRRSSASGACSRRCPIRPDVECALVAVAAGSGNRRLFENLGAHVVDGGQTMNPSTAELLAAVEASGAREAILLPNDRNVVLTAEHAAEAAPIPVSVVPTTTIQAGLAAALAFDPGRSREENVAAMSEAADGGRDRRGDDRVARRRDERHRDPQGRLARPRRRQPGRGRRHVRRGRAGGRRAAARAAARDPHVPHRRGLRSRSTACSPSSPTAHPELELEVHEGGQPHYALLLARRVTS